MSKEYTIIATASGNVEAEILRGMLEAGGVQVWLRRESAGRAFGLNVGPLGRVELAVAVEQEEEALQILEDYRTGRLDQEDLDQG
ncbi:MAG: putative signal transducing protein [Anaerolineales bacterium]